MDPQTRPSAPLAIGKTKWWLLGLGVLILVLLRNQPWDCLAGYDQAKQAFASLEMVQKGHWFYQHLPTDQPATKPPLAGWLAAALYPLTGGWWELAWRAPSFLAFVAIVFILRRTAWQAGHEWGAFLAVAIFCLNMLTIRLATLARTDMLLTLTILCGGLMIWQQIRKNQPWTSTHRVIFSLIILASYFTKGPIIVVYLLVPLLIWRLVCWHRHEISHAWPGWWPWLAPLALFILWLGTGCLLDIQFFRMVIVKEFGTNFASIAVAKSGEITVGFRDFAMLPTYPLQLLHRLFPWSVVMTLWVAFDRQGRRRLLDDAGARWLVVWIATALLLMSLVPNKRVDRIFPIVPPFALLAAYMFNALSWTGTGLKNPQKVIGALALFSFLIWGGYTAYWQLSTKNKEKNEEIARHDLCQQVSRFARTEQVTVKVAGPISDRNQSLLTYLRCTDTIAPATWQAELAKGNAVFMPLPSDYSQNQSTHLVLWSEKITEAGCSYGLLVDPRFLKKKATNRQE